MDDIMEDGDQDDMINEDADDDLLMQQDLEDDMAAFVVQPNKQQ